ncbi:MAG: hypothetical protein KKA73_19525 [Chloroflexi bacterium]|nr:hypothetical protein [Chloroflexota bacterium]
MSDDNVLLQIPNHHSVERCEQPPQITAQPGRYIGYFENEFGEQWLFVHDRGQDTATLYGGDAGWVAHQVEDGVVDGLTLDEPERIWLVACWAVVVTRLKFGKRA